MLNSKNIFLVDGIGAVASLLLTGFMLPQFTNELGISPWTLYGMAIFPFTYGIFSFTCYGILKNRKPWMLLTIISANIFYTLVSTILIFTLSSITIWGRVLLLAEILVVTGVAVIEWNIYQKFFKKITF